MRAGIMVAVAAVAALAGCANLGKDLGFHEESAQDMSDRNSKGGTYLTLDAPKKVRLEKFETDFKAKEPKISVTLKNEGPLEDLFTYEVEVGYPAPAGSFAPYVPEFVSMAIEAFGTGDTKTQQVPLFASQGAPLFARVLTITGADVRMTAGRETSSAGLRGGTVLLNGRVEVASVSANLTPADGSKPSLVFVLESKDDKAEVGNLRYTVEFYKDGRKLDLGRRFYSMKSVGSPLGKRGSQVTLEVGGWDNMTGADAGKGLAGAKYVLRLVQQ